MADRQQGACHACGESVDAPDSPMGRAIVAAFEEQHRGHTKTGEPTTHDPRCISLTDSEFNNHCDCRTLAMIDRETKGPTT